MPAPRLLTTQASLSYAITTLLDYIGFTNYTFKRVADESDPIIPYFFIAPDQNVAEVLNQLALATQTAMFFDEYNNFVIMPKEYLLPDVSIRDTNSSITERLTNLYGQKTNSIVPNIEAISGFEHRFRSLYFLTLIKKLQINFKFAY